MNRLATQQIFRVLLSALSKPGDIHKLPPQPNESRLPMAVRPLQALAHRDISIAVIGEPRWQQDICDLTTARAAAVDEARLVSAPNGLSTETVQALRRGTPVEPEAGAQVFVGCRWLADRLQAPADGLALRLAGPGIAEVTHIQVAGLDVDAVAARNEACRDFPVGFDLWLIDPSGRVCGLPRSTTVTTSNGGVGHDSDE